MIDLAIDALAAYRLTRLVTADTITEGPRRAIVKAAGVRLQYDDRYPVHEQIADMRAAAEKVPKLADLVTCRWCAGVWVSAGVVVARAVAPRWWSPVSRMLAVSAAAALVAGLEQS